MKSSPTKYGRPRVQMTGRRNTLRMLTTSSGSPHLAATSERVMPSAMIFVPQRIVSAKAGAVASKPRATMAALTFMGSKIGRFRLTGNERLRARRHSLTSVTANLFTGRWHSILMARQWNAGFLALCLGLLLAFPPTARAEGVDFTLTPAEDQRVAARQVVIRAK